MMWSKLEIGRPVFFKSGDYIYKTDSIRQVDSDNMCFECKLECVAILDYDKKENYGWSHPNNFDDTDQSDTLLWYPVMETLESVAESEGYQLAKTEKVSEILKGL